MLTPRESEVTALVARGMSNVATARQLTLSERTVESHVSRILSKLDLTSRTSLAPLARATLGEGVSLPGTQASLTFRRLMRGTCVDKDIACAHDKDAASTRCA